MSCSCGTCNGCLSTDSISIPTGTDGQNGSNGEFGGYSGSWKFSTSTSTGPAPTEVRLNNATMASVTAIYVNDVNFDSVDHEAFLDTFKNTISAVDYFGNIRLFKRHDSSKFWIGKVTAVADTGSDYTLTVTHVASNSTFAADDEVVITFAANGATGAAGAGGTNGSQVVDSVFDDVTAAGSADQNLVALTLPVSTLDTDEDMIEFSAVMTRSSVTNSDAINMSFGDQGYAGDSNEQFVTIPLKDTGGTYLHIEGRIHRQSSTIAHCEIRTALTGSAPTGNGIVEGAIVGIGNSDVTVAWTDANLLQINLTTVAETGLGSSNSIITVNSFSMKHTQKI